MIKVRCHTNLDVHESWPDELPCRPMIDDVITSDSGLELRVVRITFPKDPRRDIHDSFRYQKTVEDIALHVELHLVPNRHKNIKEFNEWYERRRFQRADFVKAEA